MKCKCGKQMEMVEHRSATTAYPETIKYRCECGATGEIQKSYVLVEGNSGRSSQNWNDYFGREDAI
jgi:lysyl-tRNA synthetase class I